MKMILRLTISIGLPVIFLFVIISFAQASSPEIGDLLSIDDGGEAEQGGPRWYNEAWHYRRPIVISNEGAYLAYYQILIELNGSNFDFNHANADGSDIRFTDSSGKNPIAYWIESWDKANKKAYMWVLVSSIPPEPYDTTIYLYYGNLTAVPTSSGIDTFDLFDDFAEFIGAPCGLQNNGIEAPLLSQGWNLQKEFDFLLLKDYLEGAWCVISGTPTAANSILSLPEGTGIRSGNPYQYEAAGFRANYGLGSGKEWAGFINGAAGQRTIIGDQTDDVDDLYLIDYVTAYDKDNFPRVGGNKWHDAYHIYEVRWTPGSSIGDIDHGASSAGSTIPAQVPNTSLPVTLYSYTDSNATMRVDWVYVRQYQQPEPSPVFGDEQGLVALGISNVDEPDPLKKNTKLTYQLTISNTSTIDAPGVVVTDTLPENVLFGSVSPSQGSCTPGSPVLCNLDMIAAETSVHITIVVTPTVDGVITNTASVGSPGYELDLGDNLRVQGSLVDSVPPTVEWIEPVGNREIHVTYGGYIMLEVIAEDNDQIERVELWLYKEGDPNPWENIAKIFTAPYQFLFDSDTLLPNKLYPIEAYSFDRAGNRSPVYPDYLRQIIYIERKLTKPFYLPLMRK
jgi:uncharacterized repeat protein (TIGR01451 family)